MLETLRMVADHPVAAGSVGTVVAVGVAAYTTMIVLVANSWRKDVQR